MTLKAEELSSRQAVSLCRQAATMALDRLRSLGRQADPGDEPLRTLFADLATEMESHLVEIDRFEGRNGSPRGETAERMSSSVLPSLSKSTGGRSLDRESGIYMAECLGQDISDFYATLARRACDEESRAFFARSRRWIETRLAFLRRVVL